MSIQVSDPLKAICLAALKQCAEDYEQSPNKRQEIKDFLYEEGGTFDVMCEYIGVHPDRFRAIMANWYKRRNVAKKKMAGRYEPNPRSIHGYESTFAMDNKRVYNDNYVETCVPPSTKSRWST